MTRPLRRLVFWTSTLVLGWIARWIFARLLAARDPISEVLLGHAGSALPLVGIVLLVQVATIVVLPAVVAVSLVGAVRRTQVRRMQADPDGEEEKPHESDA